MKKKIRIAYIGWTEPGTVSGATLALQRHLFHGDYEVLVVTDKPYRGVGKKENWFQIKRSKCYSRASKTRLKRISRQYEMVIEPLLVVSSVRDAVKSFQPDIIHTIPDNSLSWTACLISKKLNIPLVSNFQDWWPRGQFGPRYDVPYAWVRNLIEKRFRKMHQASAVVFTTSAGFERYLGKHHDSTVLFPCPSQRPASRPDYEKHERDSKLRVVYGGTLVSQYGKMLLSLARACSQRNDIELCLFGGRPDWSDEDVKWAIDSRIYRGQLSPEDYRKELSKGDVFLTVMSDVPELQVMMQTSFTTKFLEYCQFAKPTIVWGPEYCEPIRVAQETNAGLAVIDKDPQAVIMAIQRLGDSKEFNKYSNGAWIAATSFFDPSSIHKVFQDGVKRAISGIDKRL